MYFSIQLQYLTKYEDDPPYDNLMWFFVAGLLACEQGGSFR